MAVQQTRKDLFFICQFCQQLPTWRNPPELPTAWQIRQEVTASNTRCKSLAEDIKVLERRRLLISLCLTNQKCGNTALPFYFRWVGTCEPASTHGSPQKYSPPLERNGAPCGVMNEYVRRLPANSEISTARPQHIFISHSAIKIMAKQADICNGRILHDTDNPNNIHSDCRITPKVRDARRKSRLRGDKARMIEVGSELSEPGHG